MDNPLHLLPGNQYRVVQPFTDYDRRLHPVGEEWTFLHTDFLPYEDGLTLHVQLPGSALKVAYRLQWRPEEQAYLIEHFLDFITAC